MSRGKVRDVRARISPATIVRRSTKEALTKWLGERRHVANEEKEKKTADWRTVNRAGRRRFARAMSSHGRGYTRPQAGGPSRTRGSKRARVRK